MQFLICPKHNKIQKAAHKVTTNSYVCMNRYCQQSFQTLCSVCKNDHRDHSNKILTLEDITFLIQRLLKSPFKQLSGYIDEAVSAMKKFKLIQQNKRKIEILEKQIYREVFGLVEFTQSLIHEYAICKNKITDFSELLINIQVPQVFAEFTKDSNQFLSNLDYNFQKDKFEYGNNTIRQKFENRRKSYERTKRKLQQVKDYSMKIIEVILANEDSQDEEEDLLYKKKMYEILKRELQEARQKDTLSQISREKEQIQSSQHVLDPFQTENYSIISDDKKSKSTSPGTIISKTQSVLSIEKSCQTSSEWIKLIEDSTKQYELKMKKVEQANAKSLNELQNKISILVKQKQSVKKEFYLMQQKQKLKNQRILEIELKLRENKRKREQKQKDRENKLQKLIQISNWKTILEGDRVD